MPAELRVLAWPAGSADDLNPYVRLMFSAFVPSRAHILRFTPLMRRVPQADIFHIQWPEALFDGRGGRHRALAYLKAWRILRTARRIRERGGAVALTVHNLNPHARLHGWQARLWPRFHTALLTRTDLLIGLTPAGLDQFVDANPAAAGARRCVIPHPHYRTAYAATQQADARRALGLPVEGIVIGILGSLRPGKGTPAAIAAFRGTTGARSLLIAGGCEDDHWRAIEQAAAGDPRIILRRGRLSDAEMAMATSAIDIMLLNQEATLNSGSALLALSLDRRLIAPGVGGIPELRAFAGEAHVATFEPPLSPTSLNAAILALEAQQPSRCTALDALDPQMLSERMLHAMRETLENRGSNSTGAQPAQF